MISQTKKNWTIVLVLLVLFTAVSLPFVHYHEILDHNTSLIIKSSSSICFYSHITSIEASSPLSEVCKLTFTSISHSIFVEYFSLSFVPGNFGDRAPPFFG
jgi:hypothetical protein